MTPLRIATMTVEGWVHPLGLDVRLPRFSWTLIGDGRSRRQTAFQVVVGAEERDPEHGQALWDSGRVESGRSVYVPYGGPPLQSRHRYFWRVRVWDEEGRVSPWSDPGWWEMGLLVPDDWQASWITASPDGNLAVPSGSDWSEATRRLGPVLYLRREFPVRGPVRAARLYATARGVYAPFLNGRRVGERVLDPGWTDYRRRILYQTYDVTDYLCEGPNALGLMLGEGWYSGYIGFEGERQHYGERPLALAQLEVLYADGSADRVVSDDSWSVAAGPILYSDLLMGERYDARREESLGAWAMPGGGRGWGRSAVYPVPAVSLDADPGPGIRVMEEMPARSLQAREPDCYVFDLGQNMVGWVRIRVRGPAGGTVRIRYAEVLNPDGSLYTQNLRRAEATDVYILRGDAEGETFEPHFTFHGFRYVELSGPIAAPTLQSVTGRVVHSALPVTGSFRCSDALVNRLQANITWSQRGNFLSIPTDCPQRDERLGWLADAQIFARTASFNMDVGAFFRKWLRDVRDAQGDNGAFPDVAPRVVDLDDGAPAWGDGGIIIPWVLYQVYGDLRLLEEHYPAMVRWMDYIGEVNPDGIWRRRRGNDFGDWQAVGEETDKELLATAYYAYDAALMAKMAGLLDRGGDAARFQALFQHIRAAFRRAYVQDDGTVGNGSQTAYVLALHMDLLPEALRAKAARKLVDNIRGHGWRLTTGFVGVGYLGPVLSETGHGDVIESQYVV